MEAFFFGSSAESLYGVYHPAQLDKDRGEGIVICNPFGQEAMRAHRPIRQLALQLTALGYHVLRFDYAGTGDSALDLQEVTAQHWLANIHTAVQELSDIAGINKISLLGLRLGALLASTAAVQMAMSGNHLERLVLWDPLLDGETFLQEMRAMADGSKPFINFIDAKQHMHCNGFEVSLALQQSVKLCNILSTSSEEKSALVKKQLLLVVSHESTVFNKIKNHCSTQPYFIYEHASAPHDWNYVDHVGGIMLPQPVLHAIVKQLQGGQ